VLGRGHAVLGLLHLGLGQEFNQRFLADPDGSAAETDSDVPDAVFCTKFVNEGGRAIQPLGGLLDSEHGPSPGLG
jgi:hypothetical protein